MTPAAHRTRSRIVEVPHVLELADGTECDVLVEVEVDGYDAPATRLDPPEYRDATVIGVRLDTTEWTERPEWIALVENHPGVIDAALEADAREREDAYLDAMERRADADRDDRMLGEGRYARSEP